MERLAYGVYPAIRREPPGLINETNRLFGGGDDGVIVVDASPSRMLHSLTEQVGSAAARGEGLGRARRSVNLDEFRLAMAGDSQLRGILFSYYVLDPAIQRAFELNAPR